MHLTMTPAARQATGTLRGNMPEWVSV